MNRFYNSRYRVIEANGSVSTDTKVPNILFTDNVVESNVQTKANTSGYFKKVKEHEILPVNNYSRAVVSGSGYLGLTAEGIKFHKSLGIRENYRLENFPVVLPSMTPAQVEALYSFNRSETDERSKAKLNKTISNVIVDLPVELGELGESIRLVKNSVDAIYKYSFNFRKMNLSAFQKAKLLLTGTSTQGSTNFVLTGEALTKARKRSVKKTALFLNEKFLEYNYGLVPLHGSLVSAAELLRKQMNGEPTRRKMSGYAEYFDNSVVKGSTGFPSNVLASSANYEIHNDYAYRVWHGGLLLEQDRFNRVDLQSELGLTLGNVVPAIWQLTTCSFIADYFINIGDVLSNLKFGVQKLQDAGLYKSSLTTYTSSIVFNGDFTPRTDTASYAYKQSVETTSFDIKPRVITIFRRSPTSKVGLLVTPTFKAPQLARVGKTMSVLLAKLSGGSRSIII